MVRDEELALEVATMVTLRQFTHELTRRVIEEDSLHLDEILAPSVIARFDAADDFLYAVYEDVCQVLSTRPANPARESTWRADYDFLDVMIDHHLLALPRSLPALAVLRDAVRARQPMTHREIVEATELLLPSVDAAPDSK
jgi:hypothetical protein